MRLVIANPHVQPFSHTVASKLLRRRSIDKYHYFIDEIINHPGRPTAFLVDGTRSSFNVIGLRFSLCPRLLATLEVIIWAWFNGVKLWRQRIYWHVDKLNPKRDIIFNFSKSTLDGVKNQQDKLEFHRYKGINAVHITHYFTGTRAIAAYLKRLSSVVLLAENDVRDNQFYRRYLPNYPLYTLPFVVKPRYRQTNNNFTRRLNKCFAVGTLQILGNQAYKEVFGDVPLQPLRQFIYDHQQEYADIFDSFIAKLDAVTSINRPHPDDSWSVLLAKKFLPAFLLEHWLPNHSQSYFSFDIVEKFNHYRMFISPEENVGFPSINTLEGMACGCALVGSNDPMYTNLGLVPGTHYVAYESGNSSALIEKIRYYQRNEQALAAIAASGQRFVVTHFRSKRVAKLLWQDLTVMVKSWSTENVIKPKCSFLSPAPGAATRKEPASALRVKSPA